MSLAGQTRCLDEFQGDIFIKGRKRQGLLKNNDALPQARSIETILV